MTRSLNMKRRTVGFSKRENILKEIVKYYGLSEGTVVYTIIPNTIIGDYGQVGVVENGTINLKLDKYENEYPLSKKFIRRVAGFLMKFLNNPNRKVVLDRTGNAYFIDGKSVTKEANLFRLSNNQYYFVDGANDCSERFESQHDNYYYSKKISKNIDYLLRVSNKTNYFEQLIKDNDFIFNLLDAREEFKYSKSMEDKTVYQLIKLFREEFNSDPDTRLVLRDWECPDFELANDYTIFDKGLFIDDINAPRRSVYDYYASFEYGLSLGDKTIFVNL